MPPSDGLPSTPIITALATVPTRDSIEIAFVGPTLGDGRIDVGVLSESLYGLSNLVRRTGQLLFEREYEFSANLDHPIERGSVVIPIEIVKHGLDTAEEFLLHNKHIQALAVLCTVLGMGVVAPAMSLLRLFKDRAGRKISNEDLTKLMALMDIDVRLEVLIRIFNDPDIQAALRGMLRPLRERGVEEFQTRRKGKVIETVTKDDLFAADAAELDSIQRQEERTLEITKAALLPDLAWRFSDGPESFDAKIQDPALWADVERGERYGHGDFMHVILNTTAKRDQAGRLRRERTIPKVFSVTHAQRKQLPLPGDDPRLL
jgi:hypothetical protein